MILLKCTNPTPLRPLTAARNKRSVRVFDNRPSYTIYIYCKHIIIIMYSSSAAARPRLKCFIGFQRKWTISHRID